MKSKAHTKNYAASNSSNSSNHHSGTQSSDSDTDDSGMDSSGRVFSRIRYFFGTLPLVHSAKSPHGPLFNMKLVTSLLCHKGYTCYTSCESTRPLLSSPLFFEFITSSGIFKSLQHAFFFVWMIFSKHSTIPSRNF